VNTFTQSTLFIKINAALPQTQCTRCGFPDCAAYAQAIASGDAAINQCPPGGVEGIKRLASITGLPALSLNPENGSEGPRSVAIIDEAWCIGCTLCLDACPTDAIFGSNKMMHTVIEANCTGCELCIPVCPVDCISLENITAERTGWSAWSQPEADAALGRYDLHSRRLSNVKAQLSQAKASSSQKSEDPLPSDHERPAAESPVLDKKRLVIEAALARARAKQHQHTDQAGISVKPSTSDS
jgi:electron transport complex protein RnfB